MAADPAAPPPSVMEAPAAVARPAAWRPGPRASRERRRLVSRSQIAGLCALAAGAIATWAGFEAFVQGPLERPAGRFVVVEQLPRGAVCRNSWQTPNKEGANHPLRKPFPKLKVPTKQEVWSPFPQWRGEKTYHANQKLQLDANRQWYHFDAEGKVLGRLAQEISNHLRGKHSPLYDPIRDVGAYVVVTNCEKVMVSGKKYHYKLYLRNRVDRPGHMRIERFKDLQKRFPERIIMRAVWGSMPNTKSSRRIFRERLKLFAGPNHLYYHQDPVEYPMHRIKDCTHTQNLRKSDRIRTFMTKIAPRDAVRLQQKQAKADEARLEQYKTFLKTQLYNERKRDLGSMTMDKLFKNAEKREYRKVIKANIGKEVKKPEVKMIIPGSNIPKVKYSGNRPRSAR